MFYNRGEFTYEECIRLKKQGFVIPLYPCKRKMLCEQWRSRQGRARCPGRLSEQSDLGTYPVTTKCGWHDHDTGKGYNVDPVIVNEPEKFTPQHIIPII